MLPLPAFLVGYLSLFLQIGVLALNLTLLLVVRASLRQRLWDQWTLGIATYAAGVAALGAGSIAAGDGRGTFFPGSVTLYMCFEYIAAAQFVAAARISANLAAWPAWMRGLLAVGLTIAVVTMPMRFTFIDRYTAHSFVLAVFFAIAGATTLRVRTTRSQAGLAIVRAALFVLAIDYGQYVFIRLVARTVAPDYVAFDTFITLLLNIALGIGLVVVATDRAQDMLVRIATSDSLSGLRNRGAFANLLAKPPRSGVIAMLDLDDLKSLNDTYGHRSGDRAIAAVGDALLHIAPSEDDAFRIGGDEFVVVFPLLDLAAAETACRRAAQELEARSDPERAMTDPLRISWGISTFGEGITIDRALDEADRKLYVVKAEKA